MNSYDFLKGVIAPVLKHMDMDSPDARKLILGTAMAESNLEYLYQIGGGPALGLFQMEPTTHEDIWLNYLTHRKDIQMKLVDLCYPAKIGNGPEQLIGNHCYAAAMARIHYWRHSDPLPDNPHDLTLYWKRLYNTPGGRGDPNQKYLHFVRACDTVKEYEREEQV